MNTPLRPQPAPLRVRDGHATPIFVVAAAIAATDTTAERLKNSPDQAASKRAASAAFAISLVSARPPARTVMPRVVTVSPTARPLARSQALAYQAQWPDRKAQV